MVSAQENVNQKYMRSSRSPANQGTILFIPGIIMCKYCIYILKQIEKRVQVLFLLSRGGKMAGAGGLGNGSEWILVKTSWVDPTHFLTKKNIFYINR